MEVASYVERLRRHLVIAAEASGDEARALVERLTLPLEAAARLTLLEVVSAAADEITRELAPGSVEVRLRGGEPDFVVTPPPPEHASQDAAGTGIPPSLIRMSEVVTGIRPAATGADDTTPARINFRLPEHLKTRIEAAASREGLSVNAWLIRAVTAALEVGGDSDAAHTASRRAPRGGQRYTGWVR